MNAAGEGERLPESIGGLIDLAFAAWARRAPLYLGLALGIVVLCGAIELAWPGTTEAGEIKYVVSLYVELFALAIVVATTALGVAAHVAGEDVPTRTLLSGGLARWVAVLGAMIVIQFVVAATQQFGALGRLPDPPALAMVTAPVAWLVWSALNLAAPVAALSGERPARALLTGFVQAISLSVRRENFVRLCVVTFATMAPALLQSVVFDVLLKRGIGHPIFWANVPIDALTVAPVAALQTAFVLDFARRAGTLEQRPPL